MPRILSSIFMSLRRFFGIVFSAKFIELLLGVTASLILARLLSPEEFGVYGIAASVVIVGYLLRNIGVEQFIVQAEELGTGMLRSAFTVSLINSWTVGLLLCLGAPWLGHFYSNAGITTVLYFLSINFLLLPFGAIGDAVLQRNKSSKKQGVVSVSAAIAMLIVGTAAALSGASYLSIAWASNAATLVSIVLIIIFRPAGLPWLPGVSHFKEVWAFGIRDGLMDVFKKGGDAATDLVIGRMQSLHDLGVYSRAYGTYLLFEYTFTQGIRPAILPHLSKAEHEKVDPGEIYINIMSYTTMFLLPFFVFLGLNAQEVIHLMYGDQWTGSASVLQVLCIAGLLFAPTLFFEQIIIAHGRSGLGLQYVLFSQVLRIVALIALVGINLTAAAFALVLWAVVKMIVVISVAQRRFGLHPMTFLRSLWPAIATAIFLALGVWGMTNATSSWEMPMERLLAIFLCALLTWTTSVFTFEHPMTAKTRSFFQAIIAKK